MYSGRLDEAFVFAHRLHRAQRRKGSGVPYVTHLMAVAALVGEHGGTEDQVIAALLHDAVEDQGGEATLEVIRQRFGEAVARYVVACSDAFTEPKPPWRERKETFLRELAAAPPDVKLLVAADKLHNAQTTLGDLKHMGSVVWDRFQGRREGTLWYYETAVASLERDWDHPVLGALRDLVQALRAHGDGAAPPAP